MDDRTLLERAAKAAGAAGMPVIQSEAGPQILERRTADGTEYYRLWAPEIDDGDALRLAVKLGLTLHAHPDHHQGAQSVVTMTRHAVEVREYAESYADDLNAATRRAIVRAAAEIGGE